MNRKKWICTAAAITGLLLAVIAGLSIRHMKNSSYVSASELAGQKRTETAGELEENENNVDEEKRESVEDISAGQNAEDRNLENESGIDGSETDYQESVAEPEAEA